MNTLTTATPTMTSEQLGFMLGYEKKEVNKKIRAMFGDDKAREKFSPAIDSQGRVNYYNLPELESKMFVAKHDIKYLEIITQFWIDKASSKPALPQTFSEALQLAADQAKLIEEAKPKIEFHDTVTQSVHTYKYQEAGKKIQQRPNKFVAWLREEGYTDKLNVPYQRYIDQGLFKMHTGVSDHGHEYTQGRVTTKGLGYFTNKLEGLKL